MGVDNKLSFTSCENDYSTDILSPPIPPPHSRRNTVCKNIPQTFIFMCGQTTHHMVKCHYDLSCLKFVLQHASSCKLRHQKHFMMNIMLAICFMGLKLRKRFLLKWICFPVYHWLAVSHEVGTLKCLNIGTPKTINFPFVLNGN